VKPTKRDEAQAQRMLEIRKIEERNRLELRNKIERERKLARDQQANIKSSVRTVVTKFQDRREVDHFGIPYEEGVPRPGWRALGRFQ